ncbi:MAG TPA: dynamin family protein [Hyphomicrobiales bacterium]|jgi:GTP-binding protein EngB required for normal cell division
MTAPVETFASLTDARVTTRLGEMKRRVAELGEDLQSAIHSRVGVFVSSLMSELESHSCRLAVIGQIKAGKSSLINALIRRPELLPTDINPSTAVITKLYFGASAEHNNTALFQFFSEDEWDRIMSGGRAGAMTGSDGGPAYLERPLEELRQRAESRLGPQYPSLLGKHHLFSSVTGGLLERYVSAGDYDEAPIGSKESTHFSDITKSAEIYLEGQPLGYPSVIIDTPGVNDPFLVRDEITHGNLGEADIYLVVLTAQQPLSKSDIALLRMLKGLQKDRIIAVVNRIDLVNVAGGEAERVAAHVRTTLKREFPHAEIPVILASAHWATIALEGDEHEIDDTLSSSFVDYAAEMARRGEPGFDKPKQGWPRDRTTKLLYRASGIPAIVSAITRHVGHSVTAERLLPVSSTLGAIAENTAISMRHGINSFRGGDGGSANWLRGKASRNLQQLEHLLAEVETALNVSEQDFQAMTEEEIGRLRRFMVYTVDNFSDQQREKLIQYGSYAAFRSEFQEQMFRLRSQLAEDFYKYITEISKQFLMRQQEAEATLRNTVKNALPDLDDVLRFGIQSSSVPPPSIMPLSKITSLDLESYWDARAHATSINAAEADRFKQLVTAAFLELIQEVFDLAEATQETLVADSMRRLRFLSYSAIYPIAQQLQELVSARRTTGDGPDSAAQLFWEQFLSDCRLRLARCEELSSEAAAIRRQCIQVMNN